MTSPSSVTSIARRSGKVNGFPLTSPCCKTSGDSCDQFRFVHGITPAHAGKRPATARKRALQRDHPRTRGEKTYNFSGASAGNGSPPHMRGKGRVGKGQRLRVGITPAHAGKRPATARKRALQRDHPRACGEKGGSECGNEHFKGSPPRMRGKAEGGRLCAAGAGITPAHAGKRPLLFSVFRRILLVDR